MKMSEISEIYSNYTENPQMTPKFCLQVKTITGKCQQSPNVNNHQTANSLYPITNSFEYVFLLVHSTLYFSELFMQITWGGGGGYFWKSAWVISLPSIF